MSFNHIIERQPLYNLTHLKSWILSARQLCDVECLLNGIFAPLTGFLNHTDYNTVCETMRLADGSLWPMPITLDVSEAFAAEVTLGESIVLCNVENAPVACLKVTSLWQPDKAREAQCIYGTQDHTHPGVQYLQEVAGPWYIGGPLTLLSPPLHDDFLEYRHTPDVLKQLFQLYGWTKIIAFQTRNPMHRAHFELTERAARATKAQLLIHPVVGMTKPGDVDHVTRVKCYVQMLQKYPKQSAMLSLLPIAMRMAGPREALWHALIRKNYGVTHFIIGRDHAGPGVDSHGHAFYDPTAAQTLALRYADEIGIEIVPYPAMVYVKEKQQFLSIEETTPTDTIEDISGTELRARLMQGLPIPEWFTFPEIRDILQRSYPPRHQQGFTVLFTGLSGAGKSTLAKALQARLLEASTRTMTLLDGDVLRRHLSNELGFSKADRETHLQRVGYVAAEITKHRGIALIAAIAPYQHTRLLLRNSISPFGGFIEVHVATPYDICKQRDRKGLYQKAEQGLIREFTGVDSPYEVPTQPEVYIDTSVMSVSEALEMILSKLSALGFLPIIA